METKSRHQSPLDKRWSENIATASLALVQAIPDMGAGYEGPAQSCPDQPQGSRPAAQAPGRDWMKEELRCATHARTCGSPLFRLSLAVATITLGGLVRSDGSDGATKLALSAPDRKSCKLLRRR